MSSLQRPSAARLFFEDLKNQPNPFNFLSAIPSPPRPEPFFEEEWIDFKGMPQDDQDAKKIWSKALSGYANIVDGLIIWGIDARKTKPREIDAASGLRLISDPPAFESKLRGWVRDATNPPVLGVEYQSYVNSSGEGFIVCLIPESEYKPHRGEFANKHYYFRAGDNFLIAEPGLLRTLFYPQTSAYFWIEVTLSFQLYPLDAASEYRKSPSHILFNELVNNKSNMRFDVLLHNTGAATARDVYIVAQSRDNLSYSGGSDWDIRNNPLGQAAFAAKRPIHPGEVTRLCFATFNRDFYNRSLPPSDEIKPHFDIVDLSFIIYADNFRRQGITVEFIPDDLNFETSSATKQGTPSIK